MLRRIHTFGKTELKIAAECQWPAEKGLWAQREDSN